MLRRILLAPDPAENAAPSSGENTPAAESAPITSAANSAPLGHSAALPPPAGSTIAAAEITEETERLRRENEELSSRVRERETEVAAVQKNFQDYREAVEKPKPGPVKKPRSFGFFTEEVD